MKCINVYHCTSLIKFDVVSYTQVRPRRSSVAGVGLFLGRPGGNSLLFQRHRYGEARIQIWKFKVCHGLWSRDDVINANGPEANARVRV